MKQLKVLIACEESQTSCLAFRELGHEAFSCDIQPCSGCHPEWHILGDALDALYSDDWDLVIAHPPCTYLCKGSSVRMFPQPGVIDMARFSKALEARDFFMKFYNANIRHIAIENPTPLKCVELPWSTQVIQPYQFGEPFSKETHLWLKDLPLLIPTKYVSKHVCHTMSCSGSKARSKTFKGIADAFAKQWSKFILENDYNL